MLRALTSWNRLSHAAAPFLLLTSETLVAFVAILWLPYGRMLPPIHNRPWRARSVGDFWGHRWNLWYSDWSRYAIFQRCVPGRCAFVLAFAVSGLPRMGHQCRSLRHGRVLFGTMMLYFLLQPPVSLSNVVSKASCLMVAYLVGRIGARAVGRE
jgi:hypothetical protein